MLEIKKRMLNCFVISFPLYGSDGWTTFSQMKRRYVLRGFYRQMLGIAWIEHVNGEEVLRKIRKRTFMLRIQELKLLASHRMY